MGGGDAVDEASGGSWGLDFDRGEHGDGPPHTLSDGWGVALADERRMMQPSRTVR